MRALLLIGVVATQDLRLDAPTAVVAGTRMEVRAAPAPIAGIRVELLDASGAALGWHSADQTGVLGLRIDEPGAYTLRWLAPDGTEVLAPFHVVAPRPAWLSAWWTVPVGLLLAGLSLRRALARGADAERGLS